MKYFLFLLLTTLSAPAFGIITFSDNRRLIDFESESKSVQKISSSIFTFFAKDRLSFNGETYDFTLARNHQEYLNLCPDERFNNEVAPGGFCTGFMIDDNIGMTAGHCVSENPVSFCEDHYIVFDYRSDQSHFTASQVVECEHIITFENYLRNETIPDYATIKFKENLNRPTLKLSGSSQLYQGQEIFTIGHPKGLPQVLANNGYIIDQANQPLYLEVQIDTFRGNSGGPILLADSKEVIGIISAYKYNFGQFSDYDYQGTIEGCNKPIVQQRLSITVNASKLDFFIKD